MFSCIYCEQVKKQQGLPMITKKQEYINLCPQIDMWSPTQTRTRTSKPTQSVIQIYTANAKWRSLRKQQF